VKLLGLGNRTDLRREVIWLLYKVTCLAGETNLLVRERDIHAGTFTSSMHLLEKFALKRS